MYNVLLDNTDNDRKLEIKLPIVPRIGDWIYLDEEYDFTDGENIVIVLNVILTINSDVIKVVITTSDI